MLLANVGVSHEGPAPNAQIGKNDPKWAQNDRQVLRIGPRESYGCSEAFGMGLAHSMIFLLPACPPGQPAGEHPRLEKSAPGGHLESLW